MQTIHFAEINDRFVEEILSNLFFFVLLHRQTEALVFSYIKIKLLLVNWLIWLVNGIWGAVMRPKCFKNFYFSWTYRDLSVSLQRL